jgi:CRP-like cAMP-binding protein
VPEWLAAARAYGLLSRLPDRLVAEVIAQAQRVEYPKGAIGLRWDDKPLTAILLRGTARSFLSYPDGSQVTARYLRTGDVVGVFAARLPRISRGLQALEPCELLMITADRMRELSMAHPEFAWALVEEMTTILNLAQRALYLRAFGTVRQRVAVAIMDRARLGGEVRAGHRRGHGTRGRGHRSAGLQAGRHRRRPAGRRRDPRARAPGARSRRRVRPAATRPGAVDTEGCVTRLIVTSRAVREITVCQCT